MINFGHFHSIWIDLTAGQPACSFWLARQSTSYELELSSIAEDIVDKKGKTMSITWKWFGYLKSKKAQIKTVCKICRRKMFSIT